MGYITTQLLAALIGLIIAIPVQAVDDDAILKAYLTDDVIGIVYIDTSEIEPAGVIEFLDQMGVVDEDERSQLDTSAQQLAKGLEQLQEAGVTRLYGLVRVADLPTFSPAWVVPIDKAHEARTSAQTLREIRKRLAAQDSGLLRQILGGSQVIQAEDGVVLIGRDKTQIEDMGVGSRQDRDLAGAWEAIGDGSIGMILMGNVDSRRVVRELLPSLPAPFEMITGKLLADDVKWIGVKLTLPPQVDFRIVVQTENQQAVEALMAASDQGRAVLNSLPALQEILPEGARKSLLDALQPVRSENRLTVSMGSITGDQERLLKVIAPQVRAARSAARQVAELNDLRQLVLGMLNYESAFEYFPSQDGKTDDRPAGLSWRVSILPFLNESELYSKFKLDEPWDSEHNRQLVGQMPRIYQSNRPGSIQANREGKTIYQVPFAKGAMWEPGVEEPITFRKIRDGSSNTIALVSAADSEAVIWTKPDDWDFDPENPFEGLQTVGDSTSNFALADGSAHAIFWPQEADVIRGSVSKDGGEVVSIKMK